MDTKGERILAGLTLALFYVVFIAICVGAALP